jgi:hypothetical protein
MVLTPGYVGFPGASVYAVFKDTAKSWLLANRPKATNVAEHKMS